MAVADVAAGGLKLVAGGDDKLDDAIVNIEGDAAALIFLNGIGAHEQLLQLLRLANDLLLGLGQIADRGIEIARHGVERVGQGLHLVAGRDGDRTLEVAFAQMTGMAGQLDNRLHEHGTQNLRQGECHGDNEDEQGDLTPCGGLDRSKRCAALPIDAHDPAQRRDTGLRANVGLAIDR